LLAKLTKYKALLLGLTDTEGYRFCTSIAHGSKNEFEYLSANGKFNQNRLLFAKGA
jgi:hypothetical protein